MSSLLLVSDGVAYLCLSISIHGLASTDVQAAVCRLPEASPSTWLRSLGNVHRGRDSLFRRPRYPIIAAIIVAMKAAPDANRRRTQWWLGTRQVYTSTWYHVIRDIIIMYHFVRKCKDRLDIYVNNQTVFIFPDVGTRST